MEKGESGHFHFPPNAAYSSDRSATLHVGSDKQEVCSDICIWDKSIVCAFRANTERHCGFLARVDVNNSENSAEKKIGAFFCNLSYQDYDLRSGSVFTQR